MNEKPHTPQTDNRVRRSAHRNRRVLAADAAMTDHSIVTYAKMRELAMDAARHWREWVYPVPFDWEFPLPGCRVRLRIERAEDAHSTKPLDGRIPGDEDERITD